MTNPRRLLSKEDRTKAPKTCRQHQSPPTGVTGLSWTGLWQRGTFLVLESANFKRIVSVKSGAQLQREEMLWAIWCKTGGTSNSLLVHGASARAKAMVRWELVTELEELQLTSPQLGCGKTGKSFLNRLKLDSKHLSEHTPKGQRWPERQGIKCEEKECM